MLMDTFLELVEIPRHRIYITNLLKCRPENNRDPGKSEIEACSIHLREELSRLSPLVVCLIGRYATRHFLGEVDMLHVHGIPFRRREGGRTYLPVYHPASGLHDPGNLLTIREDFKAIPRVLSQEDMPRFIHGEESEVAYSKVSGPEEIRQDMLQAHRAPNGARIVAVDTETERGRLWCLSYSVRSGKAKVVMAEQRPEIKAVAKWLAGDRVRTIMHNALFDVPVLRKAGIQASSVFDTMVMAYLLQTEPQGLKALAFRHCGMCMKDYKDMVGGAIADKAIEYLRIASVLDWPNPEPVEVVKDGKVKLKRPQNVGTKIQRIIKDTETKDADPWARWHNIKPDAGRQQVEDAIGRMEEATLADIPEDDAVYYAARDADATIRLYSHLWRRIQELRMEDTFLTDMGIVPMVSDMMEFGIRIDIDGFKRLSDVFSAEMNRLKISLEGIAGKDINPASPIQVAGLLYDKLKLSSGTHSRSTDRKILSRLAAQGEAAQMIIDYRAYNKLLGTYSTVIPELATEDTQGEWRIHTTFRTTRTVTGRLSSAKPNLMAQPVRSVEGRKIRDCYIASDGCVLLSVDYSQIEMRVVAHSSNDEKMLGIINGGLDIHSQTASAIFNIPVEELDEMKHRYPAKSVGFGILYGMGPDGLQKQLVQGGADESFWTQGRCRGLIDKWFDMYSGIAAYMRKNRYTASHTGTVTDMWGRIRHVPGAMSPNSAIRERALRQAGNDPIQGGAQGIIKRAMAALTPVYKEYLSSGRIFRPLIQIHDDIVFEVGKDILEEVVPIVTAIMEGIAPFMRVGMKVDPKVGERWGSLEKWKGGHK
jgi:uracil-DNA glycosylase family 4